MSRIYFNMFYAMLLGTTLVVPVASQVPRPAGVKGDGKTDDTKALQEALDRGGTITLPAGTYTVQPLFVRDNTTLILDPKTVIQAVAGFHDDPGAQRLLTIDKVKNVTIRGNGAKICMLKAEYQKGEQRHALFIISSDNVSVTDLVASESGGDGFYIGGRKGLPSTRIFLSNCIASNNRRNGLSITSVKHCVIQGGRFENTIGTAPQYGIDLEPNLADDCLEDVNILNVTTSGNHMGGISVVPNGIRSNISVTIMGWSSLNDGFKSGLLLANGGANGSPNGVITVSDSTIANSVGCGVFFQRWGAMSPLVKLQGVHVKNPGANVDGDEFSRSGFVLKAEKKDQAGEYGNILMTGCDAVDERGKPTMYVPFLLWAADDSHVISNVTILNPAGKNWSSGERIPVKVLGHSRQLKINSDTPLEMDLPSQALTPAHSGSVIQNSGRFRDPKLILPSLHDVVDGFRIDFHVAITGGEIWVQASPGDAIEGNAGSGMVGRTIGSQLSLKVDKGKWRIQVMKGAWEPR